jgi:Haem-binding domain
MKMLPSIIISMALVLAVGLSRSRERVDQPSAMAYDLRDAEPFRESEAGKVLAQACGNCHSNQTEWPWYSHVAPLSWWIHSHVRKGREELNFSRWTSYSARQRRAKLDSICGVISTGRMPPWSYTMLHPEARLTEKEKKSVCVWAAIEIELEHEK